MLLNTHEVVISVKRGKKVFCIKHPKYHSKMSELQTKQETNSPYRFSFLTNHTSLEGMISHKYIFNKDHFIVKSLN